MGFIQFSITETLKLWLQKVFEHLHLLIFFSYKTQYYGQLRWLDVDELSVGSFEINSARFLFVFGATHLLSLFWSLFVELAQWPAGGGGRFNEALIESEKTKLAGLTSGFFRRFFCCHKPACASSTVAMAFLGEYSWQGVCERPFVCLHLFPRNVRYHIKAYNRGFLSYVDICNGFDQGMVLIIRSIRVA